MPIRPLSRRSSETIQEMSLALERVCATLDLRMADDPATQLVAAKIIEFTQRGVRGAELRSMTLNEFKYEEKHWVPRNI